jgi:hypothetical protein
MLDTTAAFDTAITANARKMTARVTINYTDPFLDPSISAEAIGTNFILEDASQLIITEDDLELKSEGNNIASRPEQVVDGKTDTSYNFFSFETTDGSTPANILDGSMHFCPDDEEATFVEQGHWGDVIGDATGVIGGAQGVRISFSSRTVTSFQLTGDNKKGEYAVDFTAEFYAGASLIATEVVTGNTLVSYSEEITQIDNITSADLTITKWSSPYKVIKTVEFAVSLFETYTADAIQELNITEQREISNNNTIPMGNIASNEADITLMNVDRKFDANNTTSPLFGLVKPNNRVCIEIGVLTSSGTFEYVPVFDGWTKGWNVPENSNTAQVSVGDRIDVLNQSNITTSAVVEGDTFKDWFETVLNDGGLSIAEYDIDSTLDGAAYVVPYGWFDNKSHRSALLTLSEASSSAVFVDRAGVIKVRSVDYFETNDIESVATITRSEYMDKSNQPVYENIVNIINVTTSPLVKTTSVTVYQTGASDLEEIAANAVTDYAIKYTDTPVSDGVPTVDPVVSGVTVTGSNLFAWGGTVEITNTTGSVQNFRINVVASTYAVEGKKTITATDSASIIDNGEAQLNFKDNDFLQTTTLAGKIAASLVKNFKDPQRDIRLTYEPGGNPAIENDDRITVVDFYGSNEYNIISQTLSFNGGLSVEQRGRVVGQPGILITEDDLNLITEDDLFIVLE